MARHRALLAVGVLAALCAGGMGRRSRLTSNQPATGGSCRWRLPRKQLRRRKWHLLPAACRFAQTAGREWHAQPAAGGGGAGQRLTPDAGAAGGGFPLAHLRAALC